MEDSVKQIVHDAIVKIIHDTASERNIERSIRLHESKIHFIPTRYRVLGDYSSHSTLNSEILSRS